MNQITMLDTIAPKSDQLNADDLIGGPRVITITRATVGGDEQPVSLYFEGDNGKPYKPGKSMRRILVYLWGADSKAYVGRSMRIYRDDKVAFGGLAVGGIRISHMSDIDADRVVALTVTRGNKKPFKVSPLRSTRQDRPAAERPAPREEPLREEQSFTGGFGDTASDDETGAEPSAAVLWMRGVQEDLEGDGFKQVADIDAFFADPENGAQFQALAAESPELAKRLNAALVGRGKALASRR